MRTTVLAAAGDSDLRSAFAVPRPRIPALSVTPGGRVIAAWDLRGDWRDLPGDFDIVHRTSGDAGRTWGPARFLRRHTPGHGFGDPSLLASSVSGDVLCFHTGSTGASFFTASAGRGLEVWLAVSHDDGDSWTYRDLTHELMPGDAAGMFAASGNGIELRRGPAAGRLLQPFVLRVGGEHFAAVARSDDGGRTWVLGERVGPGCDESKVVELDDGRVLLHCRATPRRRWAMSGDGGVTFGAHRPDPDLVDPGCNGGLTAWAGRTVCTLLDDERSRRRCALRWTAGDRWSDPVLIDDGAAGYSVASEMPDGTLGVAWESGDYDRILFARICREEVGWDGGPARLIPIHGGDGAAKNPVAAQDPDAPPRVCVPVGT